MTVIRLFVALSLIVCLASESWSQTPSGFEVTASPRVPEPDSYAKLREKLDAVHSAEFVETPLKDVTAYLADATETQIIFDHRALEEVAVGIDTPVTITLRNLKASVILKTILSQLGPAGSSLEFVRRDGFVEITTREKLDREMEPRIYLARDLPGVTPDSPDVDSALNLIQTAVEPTTWQQQGGRGTVVHLGTILVICQSPRVHDRIDDLLNTAREAIAQSAPAKK